MSNDIPLNTKMILCTVFDVSRHLPICLMNKKTELEESYQTIIQLK